MARRSTSRSARPGSRATPTTRSCRASDVRAHQAYACRSSCSKPQLDVKETGEKVLVLCEGRDAAGKGGSIKRFMEHLNPRGARVVALGEARPISSAPSGTSSATSRILRAAARFVFMDRSWYNRAGVERVMGYCTPTQYLEFMREAPDLERMLVNSGIRLVKLWFSVSREEQARGSPRAERPGAPVEAVAAPTSPSLDKWDELHRGQGGDVLLHRHRRRTVDRHQEQRQEARPARGVPCGARPGRLPQQGRRDRRRARPADRRAGVAHLRAGRAHRARASRL